MLFLRDRAFTNMNSFTGITTVQIFLYFRLYPSDKIGLKIFVRVLLSVYRAPV